MKKLTALLMSLVMTLSIVVSSAGAIKASALDEQDIANQFNPQYDIERAVDEMFYISRAFGFIMETSSVPQGSIVFVGDSITDACDLNRYYPGLNAVNRGVSTSTTSDLLRRIIYAVIPLNPSKIVLHIGINDLRSSHKSPQQVVNSINDIITVLQFCLPNTKIYVQSIYPGWDGDSRKASPLYPAAYLANTIVETNNLLKPLCKQKGVKYIDVHSKLKLKNNQMNPKYCDDGLHPNDAGYRVIAPIVRNAIK
ncbi:MAG: GDSL-type esterase/lipase family protein [Clostridia bacterium]|nr:GDSL-type esterase/lipase family protein [Clostridia bacterium]